MQHIQGEDRNQMFMLSLESVIPPDAFVRVVDTFVDAIDSFKVRAQNSLKNNFNEKKIDRHMAYIDEKIMEYEQDLERNDKEDESQEIKKKIELQELKKANYQTLRDTLEASDEEQISLTDPDARAVVLHRNIVNVGYNIQSSVDAKHKLLVEFDTGDVNDTHALAPMAKLTKHTLDVGHINVLADKGYHTGEQIRQCDEDGITTYISPKALSIHQNDLYPHTMFKYNKEKDTYTCPAGSVLSSNGRWYRHSERRKGRTPRP